MCYAPITVEAQCTCGGVVWGGQVRACYAPIIVEAQSSGVECATSKLSDCPSVSYCS